MERKIRTSKVFEAIRNRRERVLVLEGSARSTKTFSLIQHLITIALENEASRQPEQLIFLILRARLTWVRNTVLTDFKAIMKDHFGLWNEANFNKKDCVYTFGHSEIRFGGLDNEDGQKFHGMATDYVWFNEANEVDWHSVSQIMMRMKKQAFFDYNPNIPKNHWLLTNIKPRKDCCIIHSTYKDNPFLEQAIIQEIESREPTPENIENGTADEAYWKIYGLGLRADVRGVIFDFKIVKTFPKVDKWGYGMDFGFSNDPSTLVKCAEYNGELWFHEELYERGLTNIINPKNKLQASIEQRFMELKIPKDKIIWADAAEPKSIQDLCNCGWDVRPVKKGAGSIVDGIMSMKRHILNVTESSMHLIDEGQRYKWKEDKSGNSLNMPIDAFNHLIDPCRYWTLMDVDGGVRGGKPFVGSLKMNTGASKYGY